MSKQRRPRSARKILWRRRQPEILSLDRALLSYRTCSPPRSRFLETRCYCLVLPAADAPFWGKGQVVNTFVMIVMDSCTEFSP